MSAELFSLVESHPRIRANKIKIGCLIAGEFEDSIRGKFHVFEIYNDVLDRNRLIYTHDDIVELHSIESLRKALVGQVIPSHYKQSYLKRN